MDRRVRIFVSSPGDVSEERAICLEVIGDLKRQMASIGNVLVESFFWEDDVAPDVGAYAQQVINRQTSRGGQASTYDFDIVIGVVWTRMGTPTPHFLSGTCEEIFLSLCRSSHKKLYTMLYVSNAPAPPRKIDVAQLSNLETFLRCYKDVGGFTAQYEATRQFSSLLRRHLDQAFADIIADDARQATRPSAQTGDEALEVDLPLFFKMVSRRLLALDKALEQVQRCCVDVIGECANFFAELSGSPDPTGASVVDQMALYKTRIRDFLALLQGKYVLAPLEDFFECVEAGAGDDRLCAPAAITPMPRVSRGDPGAFGVDRSGLQTVSGDLGERERDGGQ